MGPISVKRTFTGKSPFFVWVNMQHAHPDHLDGKYPGTFELELTLE